MAALRLLTIILFILTVSAGFAGADSSPEIDTPGKVLTFWPFFDYRESPQDGYHNLSILGPLFKYQVRGAESIVALRPIFHRTGDNRNDKADTDYLYPVASSSTSQESDRFQILKLYQTESYRKEMPGKDESGTMLFPFYISGNSGKYGPYTSVFPFYGDIYERFWRDEYHYVLFPLYGRTVKKGTTTRNYLYPFFATIEGEKEQGFQFWPLYGQLSKEGFYRKRFALWPFYMTEESGLESDNPTKKLYVLPAYAAVDSPKLTSRSYLWPFMGYRSDREKQEEERDYFWPFWYTVEGKNHQATSFLPFYSNVRKTEDLKRWYLWPLYRYDELNSQYFHQERDRLLYFIYSDTRESWKKDGAQRRRMAFWPLFTYRLDERGVSSLGIPAPVEPFLDKDGIERNWAPFWRIYQHRWNGAGDSAVSFLWNLYWHERRGNDLAYELFPLIDYRSEQNQTEVGFAKGLIRYRNNARGASLNFLWVPLGFSWGGGDDHADRDK